MNKTYYLFLNNVDCGRNHFEQGRLFLGEDLAGLNVTPRQIQYMVESGVIIRFWPDAETLDAMDSDHG